MATRRHFTTILAVAATPFALLPTVDARLGDPLQQLAKSSFIEKPIAKDARLAPDVTATAVEARELRGAKCETQKTLEDCGPSLVCRKGVCSECQRNKDCPSKHACTAYISLVPKFAEGNGSEDRNQNFEVVDQNLCLRRDLWSSFGWRERFCTALIILTAMMSAAAGLGGGGVYVPLMLLLLGLTTEEAVPLSHCLISGGAVMNFILFCGDTHPTNKKKSRIDYHVIMMFNPGLAVGVTLGVMAHVVSPSWLLVFTLLLTLALAFTKSWTKGRAQWEKESQALKTERGREGADREDADYRADADSGGELDTGNYEGEDQGLLQGVVQRKKESKMERAESKSKSEVPDTGDDENSVYGTLNRIGNTGQTEPCQKFDNHKGFWWRGSANAEKNLTRNPDKTLKFRSVDWAAAKILLKQNGKPVGLILSCWAVLLLIAMMKQPKCSRAYWAQQGLVLVVCVGFTIWGVKVLRRELMGGDVNRNMEGNRESKRGKGQEERELDEAASPASPASPDPRRIPKFDPDFGREKQELNLGEVKLSESQPADSLKWTSKTFLLYPLLAAVSGFLGGFLGIGGGTILSPVLLELGMPAQANQATTAVLVLLSSSLATVQFILLDAEMPDYALWFGACTIVSTFIGQTLIDFLLRKYKRPSLIILSIAGIIGISLVMMSFTGVIGVYDDWDRGAEMGFAPHKLCNHVAK